MNLKQNKTIHTAQPGYFVLELAYGENGDLPHGIVHHPVIAWAIEDNPEDPYNFLIPDAILLSGSVEAGDGYLMNAPILCPDGFICMGMDEQWESERDYLSDCIRKKQEELQYKAEQKAAEQAKAKAKFPS
ncbi:hypothetical protein RGU72_05490 [Undibacterium sp. 5I1]|uniref:hypothetical protein n=1 Tax=unclassified Undibacterium TaxID=2630295 RepID=UPI002AB4E811|nr:MULTISPECIES: hypothetical protein [unclassified Undibacterium]MDY7537707.1 hypothetical protein [Undibacterium sp. 5I1]MEB0230199.1 hypothetical protein [Undibacterium sp. 10I3]MEB0256444.1 hypothetical protein [Undibacterium sp. 5I1]